MSVDGSPTSRETPVKSHSPSTIWAVPEGFKPIYSHAVEVGPGAKHLHISGQLGVTPDGNMLPDFTSQLDQALNNVEALLASAGMSRADMVKVTFFLTRTQDLSALGEVRRHRWASDLPPAVTVLVVAALARPDALVEVETTDAREVTTQAQS